MRRPRRARDLLWTRMGIVLLTGLALASILAFGFVPTVFRAYSEKRVVSYDPRLVDLLSLALNATLLIALFWVGPQRDAPEANE